MMDACCSAEIHYPPPDFRAILGASGQGRAGHGARGHEERGRTPAFRRARAVETGAPRPRRGNRGDVERPRLRPAAGSTPEEAKIAAKRPDQPNRVSNFPRHYRLSAKAPRQSAFIRFSALVISALAAFSSIFSAFTT